MAYVKAKGSLLKLSISAVYTTIAQIVRFTPPSRQMGTVETTIITDDDRTFMATIRSGGQVSFMIEWDPANATHQQLQTIFEAGTAGAWRIVFNDSGACEADFSAIVTDFPWDELNVDGVVARSITLQVTGAITVTP